MLAVWAPFAGFERLQQACSGTLKYLRNHMHSLYQRPEADGPILGTVVTIGKPQQQTLVAYTVVVQNMPFWELLAPEPTKTTKPGSGSFLSSFATEPSKTRKQGSGSFLSSFVTEPSNENKALGVSYPTLL